MLETIMKKATHLKFLFIGLFFSLMSCVDPYQLQTSNYEEAIVIEATITNELKKHEVLISKTYRLEENEPVLVSNASVTVSDNLENQYNFEEVDGKYLSTTAFRAENDRLYKLNITTSDGKSYSSTTQKLTTIKTDAALAELRRINCSFEYYYKDRDNKFIYSFVITPNDYNN